MLSNLQYLNASTSSLKLQDRLQTIAKNSRVLHNNYMDCVELVERSIKQLTGENPEMDVVEDEYGVIIRAKVSGNVSSLIGKYGATIKAIYTLAKAFGYEGKHKVKVIIDEH